MKKITILYPAHYEQFNGGAETQIRYLISFLDKSKYEISYIYVDDKKKIVNEDRISLYPIPKIRQISGLGKGWFLYKKSVLEQLHNIKPDIIYTRLGSSWIAIAAKYADKNKIKHVHAMASDMDVNRVLNIKKLATPFELIEDHYVNTGLKSATTIIAQNSYQSKRLLERFRQQSIVVNQMTPAALEYTIKKKNDVIKIVWIANLKKVKQPDIFIELARRFSTIDNVLFYMIGRCPDEYKSMVNSAEKEISHYHFLNEMSPEDVNSFLAESHLLVNTSLYEGFSNTFVQAWMRKVPVISMNSNPNDILTQYKIGYVTPTLDKLTEKINFLINNMGVMRMMGTTAYEYAIQNHSLEVNSKKILALL